MLCRLLLLLFAILCVTSPGWSKTLRKKRQAGIMINDEAYDFGSGFDIFNDADLTLTFDVHYEKPFDDDLLDLSSSAYRKESKRVKRYMTTQIARNVGVITEDVTVEVNEFFPGSTVAEIDVTIPGYFGITRDELRRAVVDVKDGGVINGHSIERIEELDRGTPGIPTLPAGNVVIDLELTYEYDISDGRVDLSDRTSEAFIEESLIIQQELTLHLVAKVAEQGVFISPDQIKIDVLNFKSVGSNTAVTLSIEADGVTIDQLSNALNYLVTGDDVGINERLVISIEELTRSYEEDDYFPDMFEPEGDVMTDKEIGISESLPPDEAGADGSVIVEGEVMPKMDHEESPDHEEVPAYVEELPPYEPDLINPQDGERLPPDVSETIPPFPGEEIPDHCSTMSDPEFGTAVCDQGNSIGSVCSFACQPDTRLEGAQKIICHRDGTWDADAPYCIRIFCQPHFVPPANGQLDCTAHNSFGSVCTFSCNERFILRGDDELHCQYNSKWSGEEPFCDAEPVNCENEYGPWSACKDGQRVKDAVMVPFDGSSVICPELVEECIDCELLWSDWGECIDGSQTRIEMIVSDKVGAGEECTPPRTETKECADCVMVWEEWNDCFEGKRGRSQIVLSPPIGAGKPCAEPLTEEEDCVDCEVEWSEWGKCADGSRSRFLVVTEDQVGAGAPCPPTLEETEDCVDCLFGWGEWEECIEGSRIRNQIIAKQRVGAGRECSEPEVEVKDCALCEVSWDSWGKCNAGKRTRKQFVSRQPLEVGEECPELLVESEDCVDCVLTWGQWSDCIGGKRTRFQKVLTEPVGAGKDCPDLQFQSEECFDCIMNWGDWTPCVNGERIRTEYILVAPKGAGKECGVERTEREVCADCVVEWGVWSECRNNERTREQVILQDSAGAGEPCPELRLQAEACIHCVLEWEPWSDCENGERTRSQYVLVHQEGAGNGCPEMESQIEECTNCEVEWGEWSDCASNERVRFQYIVTQSRGGGTPCPILEQQNEDCIDCVLEWGDWSQCENGEKTRYQYIHTKPVGFGAECTPLESETEACINCVLEWEDWGECSENQRSRSQYISVHPRDGGRPCPILETLVEPCIDCVIEWSPWAECFQEIQTRQQRVVVELVGAGRECPPLETETRECIVTTGQPPADIVCRFTRRVLGYHGPTRMRDLLLIGDESGSIGWLNFEKIKKAFQAIAKNIRGGIGSQASQVGMTSFARFSRTLFDFDDFDDAVDIVAAIERAFFLGGYRSNIGSALTDANTWLFQQTGGMRSFPNVEDNIIHEIVIATDGCRTADKYMLKEATKVIKKRGIKLYVLAVASKDERCQETVQMMVEDSDNLFEVGDWDDLDEFVRKIERGECRPRPSRGDTAPEV